MSENRREVVTPEGVPLGFTLAAVGDRASAFLLDAVFILAAAVVVALLAAMLAAATRGLGMAVGLVALFLVRNGYFAWFECRPGGATPGKRLLGLRVIDARGGPLTTEAAIARNLTRELEIFMPGLALFFPENLWPEAPAWVEIASSMWLFVFGLLPFFSRERLRIGDLVAGTLVVHVPRPILLADLSAVSDSVDDRYSFTPQQLEIYGIYEIQVLEELLRGSGPKQDSRIAAVAEQVRAKLGWSSKKRAVDAEEFLQAFYTAQRKRLEQRMLLGERREHKRARRPLGEATRKP